MYILELLAVIQNCNITFCFVWVWNLVSVTLGNTLIEGV
jgi:hypothetical protein